MQLKGVFLLFVPFILGADVGRRFSSLGGLDVLIAAHHIVEEVGCNETVAHIHCPQIANKIDQINATITTVFCTEVCRKVQTIAMYFTAHGDHDGFNPCGRGGIGLGVLIG